MALATIAGIELSYRVAGAEGQPAIVLIHGYTGNTRNWALQIKPLVAAGWRSLSVDNPGHGASSAPDHLQDYEFANVASLLHQLAVASDFAPAVICGHSMGGAIAEEYALRFPDDVRALVLIGSAGGASGPDRAALGDGMPGGGIDALRSAYIAGGMGAVYDASVASGARPLDPNLSAAQQQLQRDEFGRTSWAAYEYAGLALRTRRETLSRLQSWRKPTLIVHGEYESVSLKKVADDLATTIHGAQRVVISHAGHSPQFENPQAFNATLLPFLAGIR